MRFILPFILYFIVVIDAFFIPYFKLAGVTYGVIILPFLLLVYAKKLHRAGVLSSVIAIFAIIFSFLSVYSFYSESQHYIGALRNSGIIIYMILLATLIGNVRILKAVTILNIFKSYIYFTSLLALLFIASTSIYFQIRAFWTFSNNVIDFETLNVLTRFTGNLSDPNNCAGIIIATLAFIIFRQPHKVMNNVTLIACSLLIVASTMSATGIICFLFTIIFFFLFVNFNKNMFMSFSKKFALLLLFFIGLTYLWPIIRENEILQLFLQRLEAATIDNRISRWDIIFDANKFFTSFFLGDGGEIIWNGRKYKPHNGHFHVFYNFGILAYGTFLIKFFPLSKKLNWKHYFFLVPIFLIFTVNVGIYEPRFAGIWALMIGTMNLETLKKPGH